MKSINSTDQSDYYGETGATVVYEGSLSVSNGVLEIQFSTPYSYTGGNLLIGVYQTVTGSGSNTCYFYGQTVTGASIVGWDSSSLNNITASSSQFPNFLPKTTFDYTPQNTHPEGALPKVFSVSENTSVFFSQGNLQYIGSAETPYWKFADHQWDYLGTTTGQDSDAQNVDRDLFGWGTSGYNHGANCYQPWSTSTSNSSDYYAYGNSRYNLFDQTGQADWGYNAISNGGNQEDCGWRTLTKEEWLYLFKTRSTPSGIRYAKAKVNNVNGVILLPDDWNASYYTLNSTNSNSASYTTNTITATQWASLEQFGAVFLPAAGVAAHWLYVLLAMIF